MGRIFIFSILLFISGCQTVRVSSYKNQMEGKFCWDLLESSGNSNGIEALDNFGRLITNGCPKSAIVLGKDIREKYSHKSYSAISEVVSIVVPEEKATTYVLESYERIYLSYLIATMYFKVGKKEAAEVELRRAYNESQAIIYNFGEDPTNAVLQATLWADFQPEYARSFWLKATETTHQSSSISEFSRKRIRNIDSGKSNESFKVFAMGRFPKLDWKYNFVNGNNNGGYYAIQPYLEFPQQCSSENSIVVNTRPWVDKIAVRYSSNYHPLLNAKSWIRLPIGITYGAVTVIGGISLAAVGCYIDAAGSGNGDLCKGAIEAGGGIAGKADDVVNYTLKPDLRHWRNVPEAFFITTAENFVEDPCYKKLSRSRQMSFFSLKNRNLKSNDKENNIFLSNEPMGIALSEGRVSSQ